MSTKHILVVDDAATVRMYHRKLLSDAGWQVDEALNGLEALEKIAQRAGQSGYDLFVSDINMPRMDGYAFVRALRARPGAIRQAPVIMVSTEAQDHDAQAAYDAGANAYLTKPARAAELVLTAALMLGERTTALRAAQALAPDPHPAAAEQPGGRHA